MPQHLMQSRLPFAHKAIRQLLHLVSFRLSPTPHGLLTGLQRRIRRNHLTINSVSSIYRLQKGGNNLLVSYLDEDQPSVIPASVTVRIVGDAPFRVVEEGAAEGVVASQATEFVEEVVGGDIVGPCNGHWFLEGLLVDGIGFRGNALDTTELC